MNFLSETAGSIKSLLLSILYRKHPGCRCGGKAALPWADDAFQQDGEVTFCHSGGIGDILFSLYFCRDISRYYGRERFHLHVPEKMAAFLHPLLEQQDFIGSVICGEKPENNFDLDLFRSLKLDFSRGDIHNWYYNLAKVHLPREFWKPVISVEPDFTFRDKVMILLTPRYRNVHINCGKLERFKEHLVFVGLKSEYEAFAAEFFDLPFFECRDLLDLARCMAGAGGFIGNQSGIYSLAECMKIPRILLAPEFVRFRSVVIPGAHNNHPQGGWCEDVCSDEKMLSALECLLSNGEK